MITIALTSLFFSSLLQAELLHPPAFNLSSRNGTAVYVDFQNAQYQITVDAALKTVKAKSTIIFQQSETGYPLFDLTVNPSSVKIDGAQTQATLVEAPGRATFMRMLDQELAPGAHTLIIEHTLTNGVKWENSNLGLGFFMSDLDDREYLEQYLPTSFEYDSYSMSLDISGVSWGTHELFSNGIESFNGNQAHIEFPDYFTTSSVYFHVISKAGLTTESFIHRESSGREIPVMIYSRVNTGKAISDFKTKTSKVLTELELSYGPFPHKEVVVYAVGPMFGGMEHCGATITSLYALGHELTHSYFARGVMPANGNSGWIDEAMASWRDAGYKRLSKINFLPTNMGAHSVYRRFTDDRAYEQGRDFFAFLDFSLADKGGFKNIMAAFHSQYTHTPFDQLQLVRFIKEQSGIDFTLDFEKYIWAKRAFKGQKLMNNPMHPKLSPNLIHDLL